MILKIKQKLKSEFFTKNINFLMFFLLISFIGGNIFGLNSKLLLDSPGIFFFLYPLIFELYNFIISILKKKKSDKNLYSIFISIRRGFFLGICIEAFKVGS